MKSIEVTQDTIVKLKVASIIAKDLRDTLTHIDDGDFTKLLEVLSKTSSEGYRHFDPVSFYVVAIQLNRLLIALLESIKA